MNIDELIEKLNYFKNEYGNLDVLVHGDINDNVIKIQILYPELVITNTDAPL